MDKKVSEPPVAYVTLPVNRNQIISAVRQWPTNELQKLISELQQEVEAQTKERPSTFDKAVGLLRRDDKRTPNDEEVESLRWQALVEKYDLYELSSPRKIVSAEELQSIIPADVSPPSDERVAQILEEARLERLGES
jgi:hypothetical protein